MEPLQIIATVGPASLNADVLGKFRARGVDLVRLNMSHTRVEEIAPAVRTLRASGVTICFDTEGRQIRTGVLGREPIGLEEHALVAVWGTARPCDARTICLRPAEALHRLVAGDLLAIDFNSVMLKVVEVAMRDGEPMATCRVVIGGLIGNNKGVHVETKPVLLPPYSGKDLRAIALAREQGIRHFTLSFIDSAADVEAFRALYPDATIYAKIETAAGVNHLEEILRCSDGVLVDRMDLSREIGIERIPLAQKIILRKAREAGKAAFVASNILESMTESAKPTRGEANDLINCILDGATGVVLTKETAIGRHPVAVVNMVRNLAQHAKILLDAPPAGGAVPGAAVSDRSDELRSITNAQFSGLLVEPHGGVLIDRVLSQPPPSHLLRKLPRLTVDRNVLMDAEQIAIGTFSPLRGFMGAAALRSVLDTMRLPTGVAWPLPIILAVDETEAARCTVGAEVLLCDAEGEPHALLEIEEKYPWDREAFARKVFGTADPAHPGVAGMRELGAMLLAGPVKLLRRGTMAWSEHALTPQQTRRIFEERNWSKVIGFHTRNAIHRAHEFIQLQALATAQCDGLFVHPAVGTKKKGDFETDIIVKSYEVMMERHYPRAKVVFSVFGSYSRYAGPREAIFTAICRKNFGCSHFIVGRDHTGVGTWYPPYAAQAIFDTFPDLGVTPLPFQEVWHGADDGQYYHGASADPGDGAPDGAGAGGALQPVSGSLIRQYFARGEAPPAWLMRPDISAMILEKLRNNEPVFVT